MFIKHASVKFATIQWKEVKERYPEFSRRVASKIIPINPEEYFYLRNESVHCEEHYGANENGDAFPLEEMRTRYHTFIGSRSTVDHKDNLIIGTVWDSVFFEPVITRSGGTGEDQFSGGGLIENLIGISFKKVEALESAGLISKGFYQNIIDKKITDTSMGAMVTKTFCSICNNEAYEPEQYCEHIKGGKNRELAIASGEKKKVWESCRGVTWFEDAVIVPLELGGLAGGEGADTDSKIKDVVTASWEGRIKKLYKVILATGNTGDIETFESILDLLGG